MSFVAKNLSEYENSLIIGSDENILPVCSIYGPNGVGKSSVLMALRYMTSLIVLPLLSVMSNIGALDDEWDPETNIKELERKWSMPPARESYMWDEDCEDTPSEFSILFEINDVKYRYEISVTDNSIVKECLYTQNRDDVEVIFERDNDDISYSEMIQLHGDINVNKSIPFLVYIGMLMNVPRINEVIHYFISISFINFDSGNRDAMYPISRIIENKDRILKAVRNMGIPIYDIRAVYNDDGRIVKVYTSHRDKSGKLKEIDFQKESGGTRKVFSFIYDVMVALDKGKLVIADELDAKLHPLLLQVPCFGRE